MLVARGPAAFQRDDADVNREPRRTPRPRTTVERLAQPSPRARRTSSVAASPSLAPRETVRRLSPGAAIHRCDVPLAWTIALCLLGGPPDPGPPVQTPANGPPDPGPPVQTPANAPAAAEPADDLPAREAPRISVAILHAEDLDHAALIRAIQLRSPTLTVVVAGEDAPSPAEGTLRAYIDVHRADAVHVDLTLILADGRAYLRRVDVELESTARPIAGALANLIAGIEDDSVAPDRKDAPVPEALVAPPPAATPEPEPAPKPTSAPVEPAPPPPDDDPPRWQLGPTLRLGATLGIAPPHPGFHGVGPGGSLDVRSPRGLLLALDLQFLVRPLGPYSVHRTRVALGVGYALRRNSFELPVAALLYVEPWRLRDDRGTVRLDSMDGPPKPLLGAGIRLSPGFSARVRGTTRVRVGLRLDLLTSGLPVKDGGLRPAELRLDNAPPTTLGGAELHLGLEIGLWFGVGKPRVGKPRPGKPRPAKP